MDYGNSKTTHRQQCTGRIKRVGGASLFVRDGILYSKRPDLNMLTNLIECVFVEIDKTVFHTSKNLILGMIGKNYIAIP